jgi:hypothetical protein
VAAEPASPQPQAGPPAQQQPTPAQVTRPRDTTPAQPPPQQQAPAEPAPQTRPTQAAPAASRTGTLVIQGLPAGGTVSVDNRVQRGSQLELPAGSHTVRLIHPSYETQMATVTIPAGGVETLRFTAAPLVPQQAAAPQPPVQQPPQVQPGMSAIEGVLQLSVNPVSEVFINGESKGFASRLTDTLLAGDLLIRLVPRDGSYRDSVFSHRIAPGTNNPPVVVRLVKR